jgi:hypothetical protein
MARCGGSLSDEERGEENGGQQCLAVGAAARQAAGFEE